MAGEGCHAHFRWGWSDLPDDMLGMVYRRCCSYDRIRFAAVCSSWRAAASWHPKLPALPLLLPLTGDANTRPYSLEDGGHCVSRYKAFLGASSSSDPTMVAGSPPRPALAYLGTRQETTGTSMWAEVTTSCRAAVGA
jgi:hypothetical protein